MRIAVIAHIRFAIAEPFMGGMEAHCANLCRGLVERGHEVTLFAAGGSQTPAMLHEISELHYEALLPWAEWRGTPELESFQHKAFERCWQAILASGYDVVHNNSLFPDLIDWARRDGIAMVTSQHVPPFGKMREAVARAAGDDLCQITVTSRGQLALWFEQAPSNLSVAYNGIDLSLWTPAERTRPMLWYGRITPNKAPHLALAAAIAADVELDLAGTIEDQAYYDSAIVPSLDERRRYVGHLHGRNLRKRVAAAKAVVVTPMWDEPFGLVAAEALACDVPVLAFDRGALGEVIGDCGVLVESGSVEGLAQAMRVGCALPAGAARARAKHLFSIPAMIGGYQRAYARAMAGASATYRATG